MNYYAYLLKVNPQFNKEIYRIIQIDANSTLDGLSTTILTAFQFDNDHLYMFSLNRKRYDREGFYHPNADGGKNAAKAKIGSLGLKEKNKFMFLYDFGDEWIFDIVVKKIQPNEARTLTFVTEEKGELNQYPDWDEETFHVDDSMESISENNETEEDEIIDGLCIKESEKSIQELLSKQRLSDLAILMEALGIEVPNRKRGLSSAYAKEIVLELTSHKEKILKLLTPRAARMLLRIADGDTDSILENIEQIKCIEMLEFLGLLQIDEDYEGMTISITQEAKEFASYLNINHREELEKSYQWDRSITALMNIYGVIDTTQLHQFLCCYLNINIDFDTLKDRVLNKKELFNEIQMYTIDHGKINIVSLYHEQETEYILKNREKYNVKCYKELDSEEMLAVISGDWTILVPSLLVLSAHLLTEKNIDPKDHAILCSEISKACMLGVEKDNILEVCEEILEDNDIKLTKKIKKIISDIINEHPCALLKGYSFGEYNKTGGTEYRQLSMFDEDLPF